MARGERLNKVENATTVFLVLSFDFETCSQDESWCFSFLKGCGVERFQCFYRYVRIYILEIRSFRREKGGR